MASFRKLKKGVRAEVCVNKVRESKVLDTMAKARQWALEREVELKSLDGGLSLTHVVRDVFERYRDEVSIGKKGERWERLRLNRLAKDSLGDVKLKDLKAAHVADWRDRRLKQVKGSTVNRELNLISHCFEVARSEWHWLQSSPTKDVRRPKESPPRDRLITENEIERVCWSLGFEEGHPVTTKSQRIAVAFLFAIETGMRAGEIAALRPEAINTNVAYLGETKNGYTRSVPLSKRAVQLISYLDDKMFDTTSSRLSSLFAKGVARAGIEDLTFHDSRHEAITRLSKKLDVLALARVVGHRDIKQLMTYYNETAYELAEKLG